METNPQLRPHIDLEEIDQSSHDAAIGLFTLPFLRSLEVWSVQFDKSFLAGVKNAVSNSQVRAYFL